MTEPEIEPYIYTTWKYKCEDSGEDFEDFEDCNPPDDIDKKMQEATLHHIFNNRHHPEFHLPEEKQVPEVLNAGDRDKPGDIMVDGSDMNKIDIAEMVSDWCAVSEERGSSPKNWADMNIDKRWHFTVHQKDLIYDIIDAIWGGLSMKRINIGVVGYSNDDKFDCVIAKALLYIRLREVRRLYPDDKYEIAIISGWTNMGIPKMAYEIADEMGWDTVGFSAEEAKQYDCYNVNHVIIEGQKFGDESKKFIEYIDCLVRVGGGEQSLKETEMAKESGVRVLEYDLLENETKGER